MHELIGVAFSHYVEKARWALDRFGVEYRDQRYLPFVHVVPVYLAHGGQAGRSDKASSRFSTPVLRTDDGRTLCDSADILHYVSARYARPEDNLYPDREAETL